MAVLKRLFNKLLFYSILYFVIYGAGNILASRQHSAYKVKFKID